MLVQFFIVAAALSAVSAADITKYGQCGGQNWSQSTTCVDGWVCHSYNPYYSQCVSPETAKSLANSSSSKPSAAPVKTNAPAKTSSAAPPPPKATVAPSAPSTPNNTTSTGTGKVLKASFTQYGSTDTWGSGNCNVKTTACGYYTLPGYSAAASENLFGVGPGAGAGPGCGLCYRLTLQTDSSGNSLPNNSIVVQVTNLCPAKGNPLCAQQGLSGTNQYGANVNFDTCIDSGASDALFGKTSNVRLGLGTAQQVSCDQWTGKNVK